MTFGAIAFWTIVAALIIWSLGVMEENSLI